MDNTSSEAPRPTNPRRRKRSKMEIFKQVYLPYILVGLGILLFIIFVVSSVSRSRARREEALKESIAQQESQDALLAKQAEEVAVLLEEAGRLAAGYDYEAALSLIETFQGSIYDFPDLIELKEECQIAKNSVVAWSDPTKVINLGFNVLVHEGERAFTAKENSYSYRYNYLTTLEFSRILEQLYAGGYVLVDLEDIITRVTLTDGTSSYSANTVYLPEGKKPIMITQSHVNYYSYMTDGNDDGVADKDGAGFASRMVLDAGGNITCELVTSSGEILTGAFDMVPILEEFIRQHPDFSYRGARAILAVSGYDGVFGYRGKELSNAVPVVQALKDAGYTLACNTYKNMAYGLIGPESIEKDLTSWNEEITPILGAVDILVYTKNSDIAVEAVSYEGDKFQVLQEAGFRWYLGFCEYGEPWVELGVDYVRQGRIMVTGNNIEQHPEIFTGLFSAETVKDSCRK